MTPRFQRASRSLVTNGTMTASLARSREAGISILGLDSDANPKKSYVFGRSNRDRQA